MKKFKSLLTSIVSIALILVMPAFATSADTYSLPYVIFASGTDESVQLNAQSITVNGEIFSNGIVEIDGTWVNINGQIIAKQGVDTQDMPNFYNDEELIREVFFPDESLATILHFDLDTENPNINYNFGVWVHGSVNLIGNVALNEAFVARDDINIVGDVTNKNGRILGSEQGDITITNNNVNINCFLYAPNGTVTINSNDVNINGVIMAKKVIINTTILNLNYSHNAEDYLNGN